MALHLTVRSEFDVAKIINALVEQAEHSRGEGDEVGERMSLRLADQIEDSLSQAVGDGPCFAERVARAREQQREVAAERRERLARLRSGDLSATR